MGATASQITGVKIVYSTVCSGADQRKHQSSASLAFVSGIHRWPMNSPHKGPVTRKYFHLKTSSRKELLWHLFTSGRIATRLRHYYHTEADTKWPPFGRRCFWIHFLFQNCRSMIQMLLTFVSKVPMTTKPILVQMISWSRQAIIRTNKWWLSLPTHICTIWPQWVKQILYNIPCQVKGWRIERSLYLFGK